MYTYDTFDFHTLSDADLNNLSYRDIPNEKIPDLITEKNKRAKILSKKIYKAINKYYKLYEKEFKNKFVCVYYEDDGCFEININNVKIFKSGTWDDMKKAMKKVPTPVFNIFYNGQLVELESIPSSINYLEFPYQTSENPEYVPPLQIIITEIEGLAPHKLYLKKDSGADFTLINGTWLAIQKNNLAIMKSLSQQDYSFATAGGCIRKAPLVSIKMKLTKTDEYIPIWAYKVDYGMPDEMGLAGRDFCSCYNWNELNDKNVLIATGPIRIENIFRPTLEVKKKTLLLLEEIE